MKSLQLIVFLALSSFAHAQSLNDQIKSEKTEIHIARNGVEVSFTVGETRRMYDALYNDLDPGMPKNQYMPTQLKEKLVWLKNSAYTVDLPTLPSEWNKPNVSLGHATMAAANYCDIPAPVNKFAPCVIVYPNMLMLLLRFEFMMMQPNQKFKNTVAVFLAHEVIHLERKKEFFAPTIPHKEVAAEELRAWFKTVKDIVRPLRQQGQPVYYEFDELDNMLKKCGDKLPCRPFEDYISKNKVHKD